MRAASRGGGGGRRSGKPTCQGWWRRLRPRRAPRLPAQTLRRGGRTTAGRPPEQPSWQRGRHPGRSPALCTCRGQQGSTVAEVIKPVSDKQVGCDFTSQLYRHAACGLSELLRELLGGQCGGGGVGRWRSRRWQRGCPWCRKYSMRQLFCERRFQELSASWQEPPGHGPPIAHQL